MKTVLLAIAVLVGGVAPSFAASCSSWKATCESRGGGSRCGAQFAKCMKTGTWVEGANYGGATHSGLQKK
jgi:hypothetical protein